jgi:hypothetical protein
MVAISILFPKNATIFMAFLWRLGKSRASQMPEGLRLRRRPCAETARFCPEIFAHKF